MQLARFRDGLTFKTVTVEQIHEGPFHVDVIEWYVVGPRGAVNLTAMRNMPSLTRLWDIRDVMGFPYLPMDLGFHERWPLRDVNTQFGIFPPYEAEYCPLLDGDPCRYGGSAISASAAMQRWADRGAYYEQIPDILGQYYWRNMV